MFRGFRGFGCDIKSEQTGTQIPKEIGNELIPPKEIGEEATSMMEPPKEIGEG